MKIKRRQVRRGRVEMIPMIDTIVILLIFYMSFSRFAEMERSATIQLPLSRAGDDFQKRPNQVIVNMPSPQEVAIAGHSYKLTDLPALLQHLKAATPNLSLLLRGDRDLTYQDLSGFLRTCGRAGIADVTFATLEK